MTNPSRDAGPLDTAQPSWASGTAGDAPAAAVLGLAGVSRRFGGLTALHPISLRLPSGRHAIIGPNGAGKSTLLALIAGTLRPTEGTITLGGRDITGLPAHARARRGIGRTFQHPAVLRRLTVTDNVALAGRHQNPAGREGIARLVQDAGLTAHAATPAGQLPYGLQRRLELAMALAGRPRLLLLDEPSAGLDPAELAHLTQLLAATDEATTLVVVDHHLDLVWSVADTVTVLHHGQHLTTGTPDEVRADPAVRDAYLTRTDPPPARRQPLASSGAPLLRVRNLAAGYRGAPVLSGIDLDIQPGEAVAVLGRNGAGKTTLLNTIAGLHPAHPGTVIDWAGRPLPTRRPHQPARAGIGIVPQGRRVFAGLTVRDHLRAAYRPTAGRRAGTAWTVGRVLELLPALADRLHHPAQRLSGGEQQMLALARALLSSPRLLILDEPSEGLAPTVIAHLTAALHQLVAGGLTLLIAEQNLTLATQVTDRLVVLDHGQVAMTAPTADLTDNHHQRRLFGLLGVAAPTAGKDTDR